METNERVPNGSKKLTRNRPERLYEQIVGQIRELMTSGTLSPGDQLLPERQLAEQLGVSRSALREALKVLVSQGFIEITPGGGARVTEISLERLIDPLAVVVLRERQNVIDLVEARRILEAGSARLAARRAEEADIYEIRQAVLEMNEAMLAGRPSEEPDYAFHMAIAKASHNSVLTSIMIMVRSLMREVYGPSRKRLLNDRIQLETYCRQNMAILEAVESRDAQRAALLMEQHLTLVEAGLQAVDGNEEDTTPF
jgi:GntR family transcriptional repressor for pyruvate dehydrogenase complex